MASGGKQNSLNDLTTFDRQGRGPYVEMASNRQESDPYEKITSDKQGSDSYEEVTPNKQSGPCEAIILGNMDSHPYVNVTDTSQNEYQVRQHRWTTCQLAV